ncbi:MAG TPA: hypothetical protein VKV27_14685 [Solirubrobacteraceae bacterium]|nr:hypothetical protein [Solirubrobacteraceae bacterium]
MLELNDGWELAPSPPGACAGPADAAGLRWSPARVPGTAAASTGDPERDYDAEDWWFRCRFQLPQRLAGRELVLELDGIATVAQVHLDGRPVLESNSMWARHRVPVQPLAEGEHELTIACRALGPLLRTRRRPRARWRSRVVRDGELRFYRTMIFGRSPGFAPGPAPVGPWRPVRLRTAEDPALAALRVASELRGRDGIVRVWLKGPPRRPHSGSVAIGGRAAPLTPASDGALTAALRIPRPELWWPHTHGEPVLHRLQVSLDGAPVAARAVGFRALSCAGDVAEQGLDLRVNGVPVFARGAVWTPADLVSMAPGRERLRELLTLARDAGMNMLRVVGTGAYEPPAFHELCDELGILVWQDLMFAVLDYPLADADFRRAALAEAREVLWELCGHPSLAVVCGNSEVEQQPAMIGLDPALGRDPFWERELCALAAELAPQAVYVRSTPCGGDLPFHSDRGVAHYFGVSGYFRGLDDARRAGVRFASECLAFANVPDTVAYPVHHPCSKRGVARDAGTGWGLGAGWDFDDVRDHYLRLLFGCDPLALRRVDHARYLELSRLASGEVMAEVIGEWRRPASPCHGALVLWLKDMLPGSGLGVLDSDGRPKVAYSYLRRAMSPVCVWTVDEGTSGVAIHAANDRPAPLRAILRVALYRDFETPVQEAAERVRLQPHGTLTRTVEGMLGRFIDAAWAFRFGPPAADTIAVTLADEDTGVVLSRAVRFPAGYPLERRGAAQLGLRAQALDGCAQSARVRLQSRRVAYAVRVHAPGLEPDDDAFTIEPGGERVLTLRSPAAGRRATRAPDDRALEAAGDRACGAAGDRVSAAPRDGGAASGAGPGGRAVTVTAANLAGSISVALPVAPEAPAAAGG